jgi:hypothetical protein
MNAASGKSAEPAKNSEVELLERSKAAEAEMRERRLRERQQQAEADDKWLQGLGAVSGGQVPCQYHIWQGVVGHYNDVTAIVSEDAEAASAFVIDLAARLTSGQPWVDGSRACIWVNGEKHDWDMDGLDGVVLISSNPRAQQMFQAAGGDLSKLLVVPRFAFFTDKTVSVRRGVPKVEQVPIDAERALSTFERKGIAPRLIILDPIPEFVGSAFNIANGATGAHAILSTLKGLAPAIYTIGVSKRSQTRKAAGASAWVDTPAILLNLEDAPEGIKHVKPVRGGGKPFYYRADEAGNLVFVDPSQVAKATEEDQGSKGGVPSWLRGVLHDGREWYKADLVATAFEAGISEDQLKRAASAIGVVKKRAQEEGARGVWYLPKPSAGVR